MTQNLSSDWMLPLVEKPARYIGGEWNSITKDTAELDLRLCLVFPDLYELGLGNLGLQILYTALNGLEGVWAERAYLPGPDMEAQMRRHDQPLRMLESQEPITLAHGIGFTLQSELTYVNVLKLIQLAGLPLLASERDASMPLVFAGGPGAYNPEPLAPFMDFFVIGDGEEVVLEIADCLRRRKGESRTALLEALAGIEGVYVPSLYPLEALADGRSLPDPSKGLIRVRFIADLDNAPFPERYITPYVQLVHDGAGIEVLRGCTHGCRFCQAGMLTRPVRERGIPEISRLLEGALTSSGLEAATLVSLSTCDYSRAGALLREAARIASERQAALALPSLRMDRFSVEMADYVASMRRSGLTFAPEAGTRRLRAVINKDVADDQLLDLAAEAFRRGWTHIKLYFMIGLPTETEEDVDAIADLCIRTLNAGKRANSRAQLRTGISTFVPKPFTPFQWAAQISREETMEKQRRLAGLLRPHRRITFGRHAPESSFIEGLLSRADRRAAGLLLSVLAHGGGYETWEERLNFGAWQAAIEETGYPVEELFAERKETTRFPWDHIDAQVSPEALLAEWKQAGEECFTPDCRQGTCHQCGALRHTADSCAIMRSRSLAALDSDPDIPTVPAEKRLEPCPGVQRLRFRVGRKGRLRFLSHLETAQAWVRALRRAEMPLAYSQGFHAHPKVTFATAMPVGEESEAELMDIVLEERRAPGEALEALQRQLPDGLTAYESREVALNEPALMAQLAGHAYLLVADPVPDGLETKLLELNEAEAWPMERMVKDRLKGGKNGRKAVSLDLRPLVTGLRCVPVNIQGAETLAVSFTTAIKEGRLAKPKEIMELLGLDPARTRVLKTDTRLNA